MKYKYLVIADEDTVLSFRCAGVDGAAVNNRDDGLKALRAAAGAGVGIVIVTEQIAAMMRAEIDEMRFENALPMVVEVPGAQGPLPGRRGLSDIIREAIGVKV